MTEVFSSRSPNDCAVVAVCAVTGHPREAVELALGYNPVTGCSLFRVVPFLASYGFKQVPVPRRGQDKMTGIVRLASYSGQSNGHLVVLINGLVFDSFEQGMPLIEYRAKYNRGTVTHYLTRTIIGPVNLPIGV